MMQDIFLIILAFQIVHSEWTEPHQLDEKRCIIAGLHIDPITNYGSAFYTRGDTDPKTFDSGTKQILPNKTFGNFSRIDIKPYLYGDHIGAGDGKTLFAVSTTFRKTAGSPNCRKGDTTGCSEIIFSESVTNGETWSVPLVAQRTDMDDFYFRIFPAIVYIKETGRILIYYAVASSVIDFSIAMITRPPNSKIFSKERILFKFSQPIGEIRATYTMLNNQPIYHLGFTKVPKIIYTSSTDTINWKPFKILAEGAQSPEMKINIRADTKLLENTVVFTFIDHNEMANILISNNHGNDWSKPFKVKESVRIIRSAYCGTGKVQKVIMLLEAWYPKFTIFFAEFDLKTLEVKFSEPPKLIGPGMPPVIACEKKLDEDKLIVGVGLSSPTSIAYITFNELLVTS